MPSDLRSRKDIDGNVRREIIFEAARVDVLAAPPGPALRGGPKHGGSTFWMSVFRRAIPDRVEAVTLVRHDVLEQS